LPISLRRCVARSEFGGLDRVWRCVEYRGKVSVLLHDKNNHCGEGWEEEKEERSKPTGRYFSPQSLEYEGTAPVTSTFYGLWVGFYSLRLAVTI
jgi:hypothetical protein